MTDRYVDPATGILRNRLAITNAKQLDQAEADITRARLIELMESPLPGDYDLAHLRAFHRRIFGDISPWAGEIRTVEIAKGTWFCPVRNIESYAADVFAKLAGEGLLRNRGRTEFVAGLADYYSDINALHPFREGNGRTQRAFLGQLARDAGFRVAWERLDGARNDSASIAGFHGDNEPLRRMLDELVTPTDRHGR